MDRVKQKRTKPYLKKKKKLVKRHFAFNYMREFSSIKRWNVKTQTCNVELKNNFNTDCESYGELKL